MYDIPQFKLDCILNAPWEVTNKIQVRDKGLENFLRFLTCKTFELSQQKTTCIQTHARSLLLKIYGQTWNYLKGNIKKILLNFFENFVARYFWTIVGNTVV